MSDLAGAYQQVQFSSRSELLRLGALMQTFAAPVQAGGLLVGLSVVAVLLAT